MDGTSIDQLIQRVLREQDAERERASLREMERERRIAAMDKAPEELPDDAADDEFWWR